jgi:hypothetical protein
MTSTRKKKASKVSKKKAATRQGSKPDAGNGSGAGLPTAPAQQKIAPTVVMVPFKGKMQPIVAGGVAMPLILALASLDDPRVNAVLEAYNVQVTNARGEVIWPEPK